MPDEPRADNARHGSIISYDEEEPPVEESMAKEPPAEESMAEQPMAEAEPMLDEPTLEEPTRPRATSPGSMVRDRVRELDRMSSQ